MSTAIALDSSFSNLSLVLFGTFCTTVGGGARSVPLSCDIVEIPVGRQLVHLVFLSTLNILVFFVILWSMNGALREHRAINPMQSSALNRCHPRDFQQEYHTSSETWKFVIWFAKALSFVLTATGIDGNIVNWSSRNTHLLLQLPVLSSFCRSSTVVSGFYVYTGTRHVCVKSMLRVYRRVAFI